MKVLYVFFVVVIGSVNLSKAQINLQKKDSLALKASTIFSVDTYGDIYYSTLNQTLHKKSKDTITTYTNFQLNSITSVDTFNPLKINVFYANFNTVLILDNRLTEITKIDFNALRNYKNVSHVATGADNTIWIFNEDLQQLERFDYKKNSSKVKTVPITDTVLALKSDFNACYLLTEQYLYIYNYFGSLIQKIKNNGFTQLAFSKNNLILGNATKLFLMDKKNYTISPIPFIKVFEAFLVTNQTLYIYNKNYLYTYLINN